MSDTTAERKLSKIRPSDLEDWVMEFRETKNGRGKVEEKSLLLNLTSFI